MFHTIVYKRFIYSSHSIQKRKLLLLNVIYSLEPLNRVFDFFHDFGGQRSGIVHGATFSINPDDGFSV